MDTRALKRLAFSLGLCAAVGNLSAQVTLATLHSFGGFPGNDGANPTAGLVQGSDGNFYGTTYQGGTSNSGTVFRMSPGGSLTTVWAFHLDLNPAVGDWDGINPYGGLVQDSSGYFYGTTLSGGTNNGSGTVYQITAGGSLTNLHTFAVTGDPGDGFLPEAGLVQGSDGSFYGTTLSGGGILNAGTVFRIDPSGNNYTILHSFTDTPDGAEPSAGLVQGTDGNFYGTTYAGGTKGDGTVFQITTNGTVTILHHFNQGIGDGAGPNGTLIQGSDGNFYGTTYTGGKYGGSGTVFRISSSGVYSNLYSFGAFPGDGAAPLAGLVQGSDGNFYGTTFQGGMTNGLAGDGTVFRISRGGVYTNLYSFVSSRGDGANPEAGLVQGYDGAFYGTTYLGGTNTPANGTVFKLVVPLNPPANQISAIRIVGTNVLVSIPSVAGEIYYLQYRRSLIVGTWLNVASGPVTSPGGLLTVTDVGGALPLRRFYRFAITP